MYSTTAQKLFLSGSVFYPKILKAKTITQKIQLKPQFNEPMQQNILCSSHFHHGF